jgi:tetratricopeptide (TPR) repeat protein
MCKFIGAKTGVLVSFLVIALFGCSKPQRGGGTSVAPDVPVSHDAAESTPAPLEILYPQDEALFPPDIVAPTFRWQDSHPDAETWRIAFEFTDGGTDLEFHSRQTEWTVPDEAWEAIQGRSRGGQAGLTVSGARGATLDAVLSQASITFGTSADEVGAPLFFREVNLPFLKAVKDPAAHIRWRFGPISSKAPPPIVLEKLPVCGNCHSFSADGSTLAMEVDSGNDKGAYAIAPIEKQMVFDQEKLITWSEYQREEGELTFGLLCQVSPDGRHVVGTVKDRALAVYRPELMFSQLFFLVKGILATYDRQAKTFRSLPGADDRDFVQTNATWSPDGKTIVFARCEAYEPEGLENIRSVVVPPEAAEVFVKGERPFRYDLYRIPFNEGNGGTPEPIEGASANGMSNYFPKFSPDGKWIVFCRARNFMLLQPDSELYIIPAEGGEARRLRCNTTRMNSWHSWSPNGKWLVFSSKMYSPYTQLFLTHIDEQGESSVPVVLSRFTEQERAANIPEFVNVAPDAIQKISEAFLDDLHYYRAGFAYMGQDDPAGAIPLFQKSLELNPRNTLSRLDLADALFDLGRIEESRAQIVKLLEIDPAHALAHFRLATFLRNEQKLEEAAEHFRQAIKGEPDFHEANAGLASILLETGHPDEAAEYLAEAMRLEPQKGLTNCYCAEMMHRNEKLAEAALYYRRALEQNPEYVQAMLNLASILTMGDRPDLRNVDEAFALVTRACEVTRYENPDVLKSLAEVCAAAGRFGDAANIATRALQLAVAAGDQEQAHRIRRLLGTYERFRAQRGQ